MTLHTKFTSTNDWLVNAIMEEILGRLPSNTEIRNHLKIHHEEATGKNSIDWDDRLILESCLGTFDGTGISGYFNVLGCAMNDEIENRVNNRHK